MSFVVIEYLKEKEETLLRVYATIASHRSVERSNNTKINNTSQTYRGRQKMKSQCASAKETRGPDARREGENEWPISMEVAVFLQLGAGQLKVNSRRMDRAD